MLRPGQGPGAEKKCGLDLPGALPGTWRVLRGCWWQEALAPGGMWARAVPTGPLSLLVYPGGRPVPVRLPRVQRRGGDRPSCGFNVLFGFGAQRAGRPWRPARLPAGVARAHAWQGPEGSGPLFPRG
uniref:Uncharacterized protein n=1 Tax=Molossus molossus TaxID=27622 RepID=A0A7J8C931_MOLMO|nr:hypothetical protein HJG59_009993 [Molossus molossus]